MESHDRTRQIELESISVAWIDTVTVSDPYDEGRLAIDLYWWERMGKSIPSCTVVTQQVFQLNCQFLSTQVQQLQVKWNTNVWTQMWKFEQRKSGKEYEIWDGMERWTMEQYVQCVDTNFNNNTVAYEFPNVALLLGRCLEMELWQNT